MECVKKEEKCILVGNVLCDNDCLHLPNPIPFHKANVSHSMATTWVHLALCKLLQIVIDIT